MLLRLLQASPALYFFSGYVVPQVVSLTVKTKYRVVQVLVVSFVMVVPSMPLQKNYIGIDICFVVAGWLSHFRFIYVVRKVYIFCKSFD